MSRPRVDLVRLGRVPYAEALDLQRRLAGAKRRGELEADLLLLVEHPPVVTLGRGARRSNLVLSTGALEARGVAVAEIERGGDVTYHGPGQLVGYPILDLRRFRRDLHWYLRRLERSIVGGLARLGVEGFAVHGFTGVWVGDPRDALPAVGRAERPGETTADEGRSRVPATRAGPLIASGSIRKIASIGVHASRWVTRHGFALNVTDEPLESFRWIVPCGIDGVRMTSLHAEGVAAELPEAARAVAAGFADAFDARLIATDAPPGDPSPITPSAPTRDPDGRAVVDVAPPEAGPG